MGLVLGTSSSSFEKIRPYSLEEEVVKDPGRGAGG